MPHINLIYEQRLTIRKDEAKARLFFFGFAFTSVVSLVGVGGLLFLTELVNSEASTLRAKAQKIQPLVDQIEKIQSESAILEPKLKTLQDARDLTQKWDTILTHLSTSLPQKLWLTSLRASGNDPKSPIMTTFGGNATEQNLIGEFMLNLQKCPELGSINLKYSQEKPVQFGSQLEFVIDAVLPGTEDQKQVAIKEGSE